MTGEAYVTDPSHPLAVPSTAASKAKYPQYDDLPLNDNPVIKLTAERTVVWHA